jgi:hypothetical protein
MMFTRRVIDELVRFPARRRQLMERGVSSAMKMTDPVRQGDQYVIPESSPSWTALLRLEWTKQTPEKPRYFEERSSSEEPAKPALRMGESAEALLGDAQYHIFWLEEGLVTLTALLDLTSEDLKMEDSFGRNQMIQYVRMKGAAVGTIKDGEVYFTRPIGYVSDVLLLVIEGDRIGVVMEEEGRATIAVENMPAALMERWSEAGIVMQKKKPVELLEGEVLRVPLVARKKPVAVVQTLGTATLDKLRASLGRSSAAPPRPMKRPVPAPPLQAEPAASMAASLPAPSASSLPTASLPAPPRPMKRPVPSLQVEPVESMAASLPAPSASNASLPAASLPAPPRPMKRSTASLGALEGPSPSLGALAEPAASLGALAEPASAQPISARASVSIPQAEPQAESAQRNRRVPSIARTPSKI